MPKDEPRRHHYVPQFFLRNFAVDEERKKVTAARKHGNRGVWAQTSIKSIAFETEVRVSPVVVDVGWTEIAFACDAVAIVTRSIKNLGLGIVQLSSGHWFSSSSCLKTGMTCDSGFRASRTFFSTWLLNLDHSSGADHVGKASRARYAASVKVENHEHKLSNRRVPKYDELEVPRSIDRVNQLRMGSLVIAITPSSWVCEEVQ